MSENQKPNIEQPVISVSPPKQQITTKLQVPNKKVIAQGMQRVGKHGKSHHEYLQVMNKHKTDDKLRPISLQELSQHKTEESAWCALNGVVYDVTVYLNYHPGGDILLQGCGKQCAPLFSKFMFKNRQISSMGKWQVLVGQVPDRIPQMSNIHVV